MTPFLRLSIHRQEFIVAERRAIVGTTSPTSQMGVTIGCQRKRTPGGGVKSTPRIRGLTPLDLTTTNNSDNSTRGKIFMNFYIYFAFLFYKQLSYLLERGIGSFLLPYKFPRPIYDKRVILRLNNV